MVLGNQIQEAGWLSRTGLSPSVAGRSRPIRLANRFLTSRQTLRSAQSGPTTPAPQRLRPYARRRFRLFPFRSPLLRESLLLSFPRGTEMFQFPRFPPTSYGLARRGQDITPARFPDSGTPGSMLDGSSPGRFAAGRALHRLSLPRHPPRALGSLTPSGQQVRPGQREFGEVFSERAFRPPSADSHDYALVKVPPAEKQAQRGTSPPLRVSSYPLSRPISYRR